MLLQAALGCGGDGTAPTSPRIWLGATSLAAGGDAARDLVLRSDDDGRSWASFVLPAADGEEFASLVFADRSSGFAVADGRLWSSADGGSTWRDATGDLALPETLALHVAGVAAPSPARAVVVGGETLRAADGTISNRALVARSSDGGRQWSRPAVSLDGAPRADALQGVCLDARGSGLAAGSTVCHAHGCGPTAAGGGDLVIATSDDAATWRDATAAFAASPAGTVACAGDRLWADAIELYGLRASTDAGAGWSSQSLPVDAFVWPVAQRLAVADPTHLWFAVPPALLGDAHLLASADSGATWSERTLPGLRAGEGFDAVGFAGTTFGLVTLSTPSCDALPALLVTHDGGISWARRDVPAPCTSLTLIAVASGR
jgi:photosystem II stability/assembly factor-like uncharacterized protein